MTAKITADAAGTKVLIGNAAENALEIDSAAKTIKALSPYVITADDPTKLPLAGGTMTGQLSFGPNFVGSAIGIQGPTSPSSFVQTFMHHPGIAHAWAQGIYSGSGSYQLGKVSGDGLNFESKFNFNVEGTFTPQQHIQMLSQTGEADASGRVIFSTSYGQTGSIRAYHRPGLNTQIQILLDQNGGVFDFRGDGVGYSPAGWQTASDERIKSNIVCIPEALAKINSMRGVTFHRDDLDRDMAGVIAQDLQAVLPVGVTVGDYDKGYLSVDPMAVIALLVEAVKELTARVVELEAK
jgi:hypothetical protein